MVVASRWDAWGTWCEILTTDEQELPAAAELARSRVAALAACSSGPDSELHSLPRGRPHRVTPLLADVLAAAMRTAEFSGGPLSPGARAAIVLDASTGTVTLPETLAVDVAENARAWAADQIAMACVDELGVGCLVNLGGDIAVRGDVPEGGWQVGIDHGPDGPQGRPVISMAWPGGLATCSAPPEASRSWRSVTVAARSCERARAAAAAALLLGDSAPRWLTQRELPARLLDTGGVVVQTNGWPRERWVR